LENKLKYKIVKRKNGIGHDIIFDQDMTKEDERAWKYHVYSKINREYKNLIKYIPKEPSANEN